MLLPKYASDQEPAMTYEQFLEKKDEFLTHLEVEKNFSDHTLRAYKSDLRQFVTFWHHLDENDKKHLSLRQVVERFLMSLFYKKISKSSIARKLSCFQSFASYLKAQGINLGLKLSRPKIDKKLPLYLTIDEIFYLLDSVKNSELPTKYPCRDKAIFELFYATGIRCSELVNITMQDIDMNEKTVRIKGKGRKERMVLFGQKAQTKLLEYIEKERAGIQSNDEHLFLNYCNEGLTTRSVQRIFEMFRKFLKLERAITPHKIRHSFATHLLHQGVDLRVVQELLGHKTLASTEIYTHVSSAELAQLCDKIHPLNKMFKDD